MVVEEFVGLHQELLYQVDVLVLGGEVAAVQDLSHLGVESVGVLLGGGFEGGLLADEAVEGGLVGDDEVEGGGVLGGLDVHGGGGGHHLEGAVEGGLHGYHGGLGFLGGGGLSLGFGMEGGHSVLQTGLIGPFHFMNKNNNKAILSQSTNELSISPLSPLLPISFHPSTSPLAFNFISSHQPPPSHPLFTPNLSIHKIN